MSAVRTPRPPAGQRVPQRAARKRHSSRRYAARRVGALAVLLLVVFGLVRVAGAVFGGDDSSADDGTEGAAAVVDSSGVDGDGADGSGAVAAGAVEGPADDGAAAEPAAAAAPTTTEPAPEDTGPPSSSNPASVYIVGDSDAGTFGPYLQQLLDATGIVDTDLNYKVSSGLSRPDFFDWPAEFERTLPEVDPDIVVATFGGNDAQGLAVASGEFIIGDPVDNEAAWTEEYTARAGAVMDQMLEGGRQVIWVGIPNDDNPDVTARMAIQDQAARAAAAERDGVVFIDTWKRFSGRDGNWAEYVVDPRDNVGKDVRADDGFHLNQDGAEILAIDIAQAVRDALRELGADI